MELWEFNACISEHSKMTTEKNNEQLAICYQTAVFAGAVFNGKLKSLEYYQKQKQVIKAKGFTAKECMEIDKKLDGSKGGE